MGTTVVNALRIPFPFRYLHIFFFFCLVALLDEIAKKLLVALVTLSCNFAWIHKVYVWYGMYVI